MNDELEQERNGKGPLILLILGILLWIIGTMGLCSGLIIWSESDYQRIDNNSLTFDEALWNKIDDAYAPSASEERKDRRSNLIYMELCSSQDWDYENAIADLKEDSLWGRFLYDGYNSYTGILITDLDGTIIKNKDAFVVENAPCQVNGIPGAMGACSQNLVGIIDPEWVLDDWERETLTDYVADYPGMYVYSDQYLVGGPKNDLYYPLWLTVCDSQGNEINRIHLHWDNGSFGEDEILTEPIYFHDPASHFVPATAGRAQNETLMDTWVQELQQSTAVDWKAQLSADPTQTPFVTSSSDGYGPVHMDTSVYYGRNIIAYRYSRANYLIPTVRKFVAFWILPTVFVFIMSVVCLKRIISRRKAEKKEFDADSL